MIRALVGAIVAGLISARGRVNGSLDATGQWAAFTLGTLAAAAGWGFAISLVVFFVAADLLTRWKVAEKMENTISISPQTQARNAVQVMANGGVFLAFALYAMRSGSPRWTFAALGALAAASADTWATEIGTLWGGQPFSVISLRPMARGMSGGISALGSLAAVAGAALVAGVGAWAFKLYDWRAVVVLTTAGMIGMLADSAAGAIFQTKRYCARCHEWTERRVHPCGFRTAHRGGVYWMSNDLVNLICTAAGAVAAVILERLLIPR